MFGGGQSSAQKNVERQMQIFEIEMMQSVFANMTESCLKKCIPSNYSDGELSKGESICLDRCAAKFMECYMNTTKKLASFGQGGPLVPKN